MNTYAFRFGIFATIALIVSSTARSEQDRQSDSHSQPTELYPSDRSASLSFYFALQTNLVQNDLQLTVGQVAQAKQLRVLIEEIIRHLGAQYIELSPDKRNSQTLQEQIQEAAALQLKPKIQGILSSTQFRRLNQIWLQSLGVGAFSLPDVVKCLHLSDAQQKTVKAATAEFNEAARYPDEMFDFRSNHTLSETQRNAVVAKYLKGYWMARKRSVEIVVKLLSEDQLQRLEGLWGSRIDPKTLNDQEEKAGVTVMVPGLTVSISATGSFSVSTLSFQLK